MRTLLFFIWVAKKVLDLLGVRIFCVGRHIFVQPRTALRPVDYLKIHKEILERLIRYPNIFLHINCFGGKICREFGSVATAILKNKNIIATTFGVESAPAFLFLCVNERIITRRAQVSLHGGFVRFPIGVLERISRSRLAFSKEDSFWLNENQDLLENILSAHTNFPKEVIADIMRGHSDIGAEDLLKYGAVEHVV